MVENNDFSHLPIPLLFQGKPADCQVKSNTY